MNPTKEANGDLCEMAMDCLGTTSYLSRFPKLMKKIIETRAWECREFRGKVYKLPSLADLITRESLEGWGESLEKVESLIKEDPQTLAMFRAEITRASHRPKKEQCESNNNIITKAKQGTGKAYTLTRLSNENPDLYKQVCAGELTANAAAIAAGWRKKTVTVVDDPEKAAKALKKTFGEEWLKEMSQAAGVSSSPVEAKDPSSFVFDPDIEGMTYEEIDQILFSRKLHRLLLEYLSPSDGRQGGNIEDFLGEDPEKECVEAGYYIRRTLIKLEDRALAQGKELSDDELCAYVDAMLDQWKSEEFSPNEIKKIPW